MLNVVLLNRCFSQYLTISQIHIYTHRELCIVTFLAPDLLVAPPDFFHLFQIKQASSWTPEFKFKFKFKFIHIIF